MHFNLLLGFWSSTLKVQGYWSSNNFTSVAVVALADSDTDIDCTSLNSREKFPMNPTAVHCMSIKAVLARSSTTTTVGNFERASEEV
jgi:hypothetical protein